MVIPQFVLTAMRPWIALFLVAVFGSLVITASGPDYDEGKSKMEFTVDCTKTEHFGVGLLKSANYSVFLLHDAFHPFRGVVRILD